MDKIEYLKGKFSFLGVHMAEFIATDYLVNSLLFHAYKYKYMDFIVGPESSPQLKTLLLTTCESGYCIGEYLGELSNQYPNREVEIHFSTRKVNYKNNNFRLFLFFFFSVYLFSR